jgi:2-methylisocitrate lyase-like PEP mutase family enzyme
VLGRSPDEIKEAVAKALSLGCIGVTIGDGGRNGKHGVAPIEHVTACVKAARSAASEARIPAVITVGVEAFLLEPLGHSPFEMTVERAERYFEAGADCILVPGVQHLQLLDRLTAVIDGPLAITIGVNLAPDVKSFARAGVACVTLGASMMRSLLGVMRFKAEELHAFGHFTHFDRAIPADQLDALLRRRD